MSDRFPKTEGGEINYCIIDGLSALVWASNLADLELHTFLHTAPRIERPNWIAFDLDPRPPANIIECCKVELWVRDIFQSLGLESFAYLRPGPDAQAEALSTLRPPRTFE